MSFKFEDSYLKRLGIWKRVNRLRVLSTILVKLTFLASGATLLICLPTSLGGHFSKIKVVKRKKPEGCPGRLWIREDLRPRLPSDRSP